MSLIIRVATPEDAAVVAALIREAFEEYRPILDPPSGAHEETAESIAARLVRDAALVAWCDGEPVACVLIGRQREWPMMSRLAVRPSLRGQGIGEALVRAAEASARSAGFCAMRLGVRLQLSRVLAWYERLGYCQIELRCHGGCARPTYAILEKTL